MDSLLAGLNLSRDAINITVFVITCVVAVSLRRIAMQAARKMIRGELHDIPAIDWFLCGIWWMALLVGLNQICGVFIIRLIETVETRRIVFALNDHLMIGVVVACIVALTSSKRISVGHDAARRLLWRLFFLVLVVYAASMTVGFLFDRGR